MTRYRKVKTWLFFNPDEIEPQRQKMLDWIEKNRKKYEIREFFVNNAWAVEYRELIKM